MSALPHRQSRFPLPALEPGRAWSLLIALLLPGALASRTAADEPQSIEIHRARSEQTSLILTQEHCGIDRAQAQRLGWVEKQQARVRLGEITALYTMEWLDDDRTIGGVGGAGELKIRMGQSARARLGLGRDSAKDEPVPAVLEPFGPHPTLTDREAQARGEFVERLLDNGTQTSLLILAPHGGDIERHTEEQALHLRAKIGPHRASAWYCLGFAFTPNQRQAFRERGLAQPPTTFQRWHITSADFSEKSFPKLKTVASRRYHHVVSFHGMNGEGILLGGAAPTSLKQELARELEQALGPQEARSDLKVRIAKPGAALSGSTPANIVNRYAHSGGIQIEQSSSVRRDFGIVVADAVAHVLERHPPGGPTPSAP